MKLITKLFNTITITIILFYSTPIDMILGQDAGGFVKGEQAPHFEAELIDDEGIVNNDFFEGNYVLMDFWSTGCSVCVQNRPKLEKIWNKYKSENFTIWSVAMFDAPEKLHQFRNERYSMPWLHTVFPVAQAGTFMSNLNIRDFPNYVLISPKGEVLATINDFRKSSMEKVIGEFLNQ